MGDEQLQKTVSPGSGPSSELDNLVVPKANLAERWRRLLHMKQFTLWMLYVSLGLIMLGFDWAAFPQFLALPSYAERFGSFDEGEGAFIVSARVQACWNATSSAMQLLGGFAASFAMDKIGRRWWLLIMTVLQSVSNGVIYHSPDWKVMTVGRVLQGLSTGGLTTFSPLYIGENTIPELRGFFLISYNAFIVLGQFFMALVIRGSLDTSGHWPWRIPVLSMFVFPAIVLVFFFWFPESPYYLLCIKKDEEGARKSLLRLHGNSKGDLADKEIARMRDSIRIAELLAKKRGKGFRFWELFSGTNLRRTLIAIIVPAAQQISGVAFVVGYIPYYLTLAGISNPFNWSMYLYTVNLVSNIAAFWTVERVGRRAFLVYGLLLMAILNIIIGALNVNPTYSQYIATIALIYCWSAVYSLSVGSLGLVVSSEIGTPPLRSETQAIVTGSQAFFGWVFLFSVPYMINPDAGNLGGKVGFIFGSFSFVLFLFCFFIVPETKGLTFSELDLLFAKKVKSWNFTKAIKEYRANEGRDASDTSESAGGEDDIVPTKNMGA